MLSDLRFAFRQLTQKPGFTAVVVLTLALGIGANTAIFSVVHALLLSPLPYPESERIVQVWHSPTPGARNAADGGTFLDWKQHTAAFESFAGLHPIDLNFSGAAEPAQISGYAVTADYLRVFRISPTMGRAFTDEEDSAGGDNFVAIVTHEMWRQRLGGDPDIVGKTIHLDGRSYTVIGVLAPNALNTPGVEFLIPAAISATEYKQHRNYDYRCVVFGRLKPGATITQAQSELASAAASFRSLNPPYKADWTITVEALQASVTSGPRPYVLMLMATVGLVLLIACANVANLLLARAATRQGEIAVRVALGASTARIIRLLLVESTVLALCGGIAGLFVATVVIGPLIKFATAGFAPGAGFQIELNPAVLLFTLGVAFATGILFGLVPALRVARPDLTRDLKESSRGTAGGSRQRLQRIFIVAETAVTVVLLFTAGLLLRSFILTMSADTGMQRENILLFDLNRTSEAALTPAHRVRFVESVLREISARSGIASVGMISSSPFNNRNFLGGTIRRSENHDPHADIETGFDSVSGALFQSLGSPLMRGRFLTDGDSTTDAPKVLLVNHVLARQLFADEDPLGRQVHFNNADWEIVGIVGNMSRSQLDAPPPPMLYMPVLHFPWRISIAVRSQISQLAAVEAIRQAVKAVDPNQPIANLRTMEQAIDNSVTLRLRRTMMILVGAFAGIALVLACVGLYGVMNYSVTQCTREIGVRIALGADSATVLRHVVRGGVMLVFIGVFVGALGSVGASYGVASQLYGTKLADRGIIFALVTGTLLAVATLACWIPARRATRINPIEALRAE